jgi:glycine cleavage system aminomethyltransferase T
MKTVRKDFLDRAARLKQQGQGRKERAARMVNANKTGSTGLPRQHCYHKRTRVGRLTENSQKGTFETRL